MSNRKNLSHDNGVEPGLQSPEFSRPILVDEIGDDGLEITIIASADECAALARRFGWVALDRFEATVRLDRRADTTVIRLSADFSADMVQSCVVSLAPVATHLAERFTLLYAPDSMLDRTSQVAISPESLENPESLEMAEPIVGGAIDIGEAVAEQLALAVDPYPRAAGAVLEVAVEEGPRNPFAALAALRANSN